jgi:hypothetical protein
MWWIIAILALFVEFVSAALPVIVACCLIAITVKYCLRRGRGWN